MLRLRTLGSALFETDRALITPAAEAHFALLLYLVLERGRAVPRIELAELLWSDADARHQHHCLRQSTYVLRQQGAPVETDRKSVWIAETTVDCDAHALLATAAPTADLVTLIGGSFLPGYAPRLSSGYRRWLEHQRDITHAAVRRVLVSAIGAAKERGDWAAVERLARRCLEVDPLNEEAILSLAEGAALHGSKVHALEILDRYLQELGPQSREIRLPAAILRRRVAEAAPHQTALANPSVPMVGRASELGTLNRALHLASAGQGCIVLVSGEPGIGKSRLAADFSRAAELQRVRVATVRLASHDVRRPLSAFADLVPLLLDMPGALGCSPESLAFLRTLVEHDAGSTDAKLPTAADVVRSSRGVRAAIFDLLDAVASEGTLLVVIEDVHWLDELSAELLAELVPWCTTRRAMLVLTSRRADAVRLAGVVPEELRMIALAPLPERFGRDLLRALSTSHSRTFSDDFARWCLSVSAGNPYFLTELSYQSASIENPSIPESIVAVIRNRLSQLTPTARRVLQSVVILATDATIALLAESLELGQMALLDALDELSRAWLIESDGASVRYRHDLLAQAALAEMSVASRRLMHRSAAQLLQREVERTKSSALMWRCAEHWQEAGEDIAVLEVIRSCAQYSARIGLPKRAAEVMELALRFAMTEARDCRIENARCIEYFDLASQVAATSDSVLLRMRASLGKAAALRRLGGHAAECLALYKQAAHLAFDAGDKRAQAQSLTDFADALLQLRDESAEAHRLLERAIECARDSDDTLQLGTTTLILGNAAKLDGQFVRADTLLAEACQMFAKVGDANMQVRGWSDYAVLQFELGRPAEAERLYRQAIAALELLGDWNLEATERANLAEVLIALGRTDEAETEAKIALAIVESRDVRSVAAAASNTVMATVKRLRGETDAARHFLARAELLAIDCQRGDLLRWVQGERVAHDAAFCRGSD